MPKKDSFESLTILLSSLVYTSFQFSYLLVFVCFHLDFSSMIAMEERKKLILLLDLRACGTCCGHSSMDFQAEGGNFATLCLVYESMEVKIEDME